MIYNDYGQKDSHPFLGAVLFVKERYVIGEFVLADDNSPHKCIWDADNGYSHPSVFDWTLYVSDEAGSNVCVIKCDLHYGSIETCAADARRMADRMSLSIAREDVGRIGTNR